MAFAYFPHTEEDIKEMLAKVGISSLDGLYSDVPREFLHKGEYKLPEAMSEIEVRKYFEELASMNRTLKVFSGYGAYDHYCPAVVPYITSRSEYLTAYTPYQAEVSQGTLRYIFEWQSMICRLTGMDVSNASMYDGATAAAEAALMTVACTKKKSRVLVSDALLSQIRKVVETYASWHGVKLTVLPLTDGHSTLSSVEDALKEYDDVAGLIVPQINRFGVIEDLSGYADALHNASALLVTYIDPSSLAVLKTPAEWGADIACGDGQSLGLPLSFGGPYVGILCCKDALVRKLPGRIVGRTTDVDGKRAFVLTLQAREQHIRREKATSNICSNQGLMSLYVTVYLSLMGKEGLVEANSLCYDGAHYLHDCLMATGLFEDPFAGQPYLKEFTLKPLCDADALRSALVDNGFFAGVATPEGYMNFCVTEKHGKDEVDELVAVVKNACAASVKNTGAECGNIAVKNSNSECGNGTSAAKGVSADSVKNVAENK